MPAAQNDDLFPDARNREFVRFINERGLVRNQDGHCVVVVSGIVLAQYAVNDRLAEAHAMVSLVEQGWANQIEIARAFACSARTVRRHQRRFESGGLAALGRGDGYPRGRTRLTNAREQLVQKLKVKGVGQREIARRLGVSEKAIRKLLRRLGWKPADAQSQLTFETGPAAESNPPAATAPQVAVSADPNLSAIPTTFQASGASQDTDPSDRSADRLLARLGLLEDAPPLFGSAATVPRAGVLLAIPVLIASGVFQSAQTIYGSLGPAFYGLRTSLLTLLLLALWRI
jgi:transposase